MKKSKLEEYLNKQVTVELFGGETFTGILYKTGEENIKNISELYLKRNYYFIDYNSYDSSNYINSPTISISCLFRSSHVKTIKILK